MVAKAILEFSKMPKSCRECPLYKITDGDREKLCEFEEYLVKGNVYENPELLEG